MKGRERNGMKRHESNLFRFRLLPFDWSEIIEEVFPVAVISNLLHCLVNLPLQLISSLCQLLDRTKQLPFLLGETIGFCQHSCCSLFVFFEKLIESHRIALELAVGIMQLVLQNRCLLLQPTESQTTTQNADDAEKTHRVREGRRNSMKENETRISKRVERNDKE